ETRAPRPVDPGEAQHRGRLATAEQQALRLEKAPTGEALRIGRGGLVDPAAVALAVHGGTRGEDRALERRARSGEGIKHVAQAVDVGTAVGVVAEAVGRGRVDQHLHAFRRPAESVAGGEIAAHTSDRWRQRIRVTAQTTNLVAVGRERHSETGTDVAAA